jgi:hypothetical protein
VRTSGPWGGGGGRGAVAAFRPQVGVEVQWRVDAGRGQQRADLFGDGCRPAHRSCVVGAGGRLADEHDVGVRPVAQLAAAEAAHPDDRERGRCAAGPVW